MIIEEEKNNATTDYNVCYSTAMVLFRTNIYSANNRVDDRNYVFLSPISKLFVLGDKGKLSYCQR